jgi:hypothetical protein
MAEEPKAKPKPIKTGPVQKRGGEEPPARKGSTIKKA